MSSQAEHAAHFAGLHKKGDPLILFNCWDAGSAKTVVEAGAKALATGSASVALAHGYADGENIPLDFALQVFKRIVDTVELPVSLDLEGAYGAAPETVAANVTLALQAGAIGFNFEDQVVGGEGLYDVNIQAERVRASRKAAEAYGLNAVINARTDIFLKAKPETHNAQMLDEAIERAAAYQDAGASCFFAPGLADEKLIATLCDKVSLPVNIIALPHVPAPKKLVELGVSRISYGPVPYRQMIKQLAEAAATAYA